MIILRESWPVIFSLSADGDVTATRPVPIHYSLTHITRDPAASPDKRDQSSIRSTRPLSVFLSLSFSFSAPFRDRGRPEGRPQGGVRPRSPGDEAASSKRQTALVASSLAVTGQGDFREGPPATGRLTEQAEESPLLRDRGSVALSRRRSYSRRRRPQRRLLLLTWLAPITRTTTAIRCS